MNSILKIVVIYVLPYIILMYIAICAANNKSDLDTAIVIISLLSLIFNNISSDFISIKDKANQIAIKTYEYIYKMFMWVSGFSLASLILLPLIYFSISNNDTVIYKEYYTSHFFFISLIFHLVLFLIGASLRKYKEKYKEKENFPYAAFWLLILMTYIASILLYYNKL